MRLDRAGEVCAEHAPSFRTLPPRLGFFNTHGIHCEQKGSGEIGPEVKISTMQRVPRRVHLVAGKRIPRRIALGDHCAIELLDRDPFWCKHRALIGSPIWRDRRSFLVQPNGHAPRVCILRHASERKETAAAYNRCLDLFIPVPAIRAAVRVNNFDEEFVHPVSLSRLDLCILLTPVASTQRRCDLFNARNMTTSPETPGLATGL